MVQYIDTIPEKNLITSDEHERADSDSDRWTEPDQQSGESPKLLHSLKSPTFSTPTSNINSSTPSTVVTPGVTSITKLDLGTMSDQLSKTLPPDDGFPDLIVFVSLDNSGIGYGIYSALMNCNVKVLGIETDNDLKIALPHIVGKVQKFCNNNAKPPPPLNIAVVGTDSFLSAITKHYVTQLSSRPHDWQNYFSFIYAPFQRKLN